jgi:endoglucanase
VALSLLLVFAAGGCRQQSWPLWNAYSARFIDAQGRVFDPKGDQHTTSEGQAYALFFSLVSNRRDTFDRVLNWTQANLAAGHLEQQLPAWLYGKNDDGQWQVLDANSASDADVWLAYTLIEAGRLWQNPPYDALGRGMLALIAKKEVADLPGFGPMLLPAPQGFQHGTTTTLNPSYLPVFLFDRFAAVDPGGPWIQIAVRIPTLLGQSARHGFAMDWVDYVPGDGFYPAAKPGATQQKDPDGPVGSYDAIRVYLWAGMMDAKASARAGILNALPAMSIFLAQHDAPPEKINQQGIPEQKDGPVGFSAAVLPYLRDYPGFAQISTRQLVRMASQRNAASGLYGKDLAYYDQNLALFSTGFLDGRFAFGQSGELNVKWKLR